jgi:hypothetical protein
MASTPLSVARGALPKTDYMIGPGADRARSRSILYFAVISRMIHSRSDRGASGLSRRRAPRSLEFLYPATRSKERLIHLTRAYVVVRVRREPRFARCATASIVHLAQSYTWQRLVTGFAIVPIFPDVSSPTGDVGCDDAWPRHSSDLQAVGARKEVTRKSDLDSMQSGAAQPT